MSRVRKPPFEHSFPNWDEGCFFVAWEIVKSWHADNFPAGCVFGQTPGAFVLF